MPPAAGSAALVSQRQGLRRCQALQGVHRRASRHFRQRRRRRRRGAVRRSSSAKRSVFENRPSPAVLAARRPSAWCVLIEGVLGAPRSDLASDDFELSERPRAGAVGPKRRRGLRGARRRRRCPGARRRRREAPAVRRRRRRRLGARRRRHQATTDASDRAVARGARALRCSLFPRRGAAGASPTRRTATRPFRGGRAEAEGDGCRVQESFNKTKNVCIYVTSCVYRSRDLPHESLDGMRICAS